MFHSHVRVGGSAVINAPILEQPPARGDAQAMRIKGHQVIAAPNASAAVNYTQSLSSMTSSMTRGGLSSGLFGALKPQRPAQVCVCAKDQFVYATSPSCDLVHGQVCRMCEV